MKNPVPTAPQTSDANNVDWENMGGSPKGGVDVMDVVVIVQRVQKIGHFLAVGVADFREVFREITDFGGDNVPAARFQTLGNGVEILDLGEKSRASLAFGNLFGFQRFDLLRTAFDGVAFGVLLPVGVSRFHHSHVIEEKSDAPWLAQRAGFEEITNFRRGPIPIVGEAFDDYGNLVRAESFVSHLFENDLFVGEPGTFFDGAFDGVAGDGILPGLFDGGGEAGVEFGISAAEFGGDHDFAHQFNDELAFFLGVRFAPGLFPLSSHISLHFGETRCFLQRHCEARLRSTEALPHDFIEGLSIANVTDHPKKTGRVVVAGGGAAGIFGALTCAEAAPGTEIIVLEKAPEPLTKVRISGGGRCNVTHDCFDPAEFAPRYPRGERALRSAFHRFQAKDTVEWFESRGVALKTEPDGRMFPTTDSSQTIIDCLLAEARRLGVSIRTGNGLESIRKREHGGFEMNTSRGENWEAACVLLATGGCRAASMAKPALDLGHTLVSPVPSLFTFTISAPWLRQLAGISVETASVTIPETRLSEIGPLLITHAGLSGPVILRLSAWGARILSDRNYAFPLLVNWLPKLELSALDMEIEQRKTSVAARKITNAPIGGLPSRLWEALVIRAGIDLETRWAHLNRQQRHELIQILTRSELRVEGKSLNKDEFVTCGGIPLPEVDFKTMESRICPGLFFAGEVLDFDGITGGFNFQAAWTTGWIAGRAIAAALQRM
jgi:predicted Rossmann fold flavoprotein